MNERRLFQSRQDRIRVRSRQLEKIIDIQEEKYQHQPLKELSPWNSDEYKKSIYPSKLPYANQIFEAQERLKSRQEQVLTQGSYKFQASKEFIQLIKLQKRKETLRETSCRRDETKLNKVDVELDEDLLYSPEKVHGASQYFSIDHQQRKHHSRYDTSRQLIKEEPTRIKIIKKMREKRTLEEEEHLFTNVTNQQKQQSQQNTMSMTINSKMQNQASDRRKKAFQTINLEMSPVVKVDKWKEFNKVVYIRKPKILSCRERKEGISKEPTLKYSLMECKGEMCFNDDTVPSHLKIKKI